MINSTFIKASIEIAEAAQQGQTYEWQKGNGPRAHQLWGFGVFDVSPEGLHQGVGAER